MIELAKPYIGEAEQNAVEEVLISGNLAQGERVEEFENKFADYIGTEYAVAVSSGTAALHLALLTAYLEKGEDLGEVRTTPFSFIATSNSILLNTGRPVFHEIDHNFNMSFESYKEFKDSVIVPVHLFGRPCDIPDEFLKNNIVIEDCAQAHGASINGKKVGSLGTMGCFSFYPTKNMTTGEGGMITTNHKDLRDNLRSLRDHGRGLDKNSFVFVGYNYRMTDMAAAIGLCQLERLEDFNRARRLNANKYNKSLVGIRGLVLPPEPPENVKHVYNQYTILVTPDFPLIRDELKERLLELAIQTGVYYPKYIIDQPYFETSEIIGELDFDIPNQVLSLPIHPGLSYNDIDYIVYIIKDLYERYVKKGV